MSDYLFERWRQPATVIHAEDDLDGVMSFEGDDRKFRDTKLTLAPKDVARLMEGRLCFQCLEPFPEAFPLLCPVCGYEVRDRQPVDFARTYRGVEDLRFADIEAEEARMQEENERRRHNPNSRIWLPTKEIK